MFNLLVLVKEGISHWSWCWQWRNPYELHCERMCLERQWCFSPYLSMFRNLMAAARPYSIHSFLMYLCASLQPVHRAFLIASSLSNAAATSPTLPPMPPCVCVLFFFFRVGFSHWVYVYLKKDFYAFWSMCTYVFIYLCAYVYISVNICTHTLYI